MRTWQAEMQGVAGWRGAKTLRRLHRGVVDLSDPDTLRNFDARFALRLGAPPEAVEAGVIVKLTPSRVLVVWAGIQPARSHYEGARPAWTHSIFVDTDDPLLARALAWKHGGSP